jgi:D-galactarolactone cycloisomerase
MKIVDVDIALWDIMGKALNQPIYNLVGGAFRTRVQCYATGLYRKKRQDPTAALVAEARAFVANEIVKWRQAVKVSGAKAN